MERKTIEGQLAGKQQRHQQQNHSEGEHVSGEASQQKHASGDGTRDHHEDGSALDFLAQQSTGEKDREQGQHQAHRSQSKIGEHPLQGRDGGLGEQRRAHHQSDGECRHQHGDAVSARFPKAIPGESSDGADHTICPPTAACFASSMVLRKRSSSEKRAGCTWVTFPPCSKTLRISCCDSRSPVRTSCRAPRACVDCKGTPRLCKDSALMPSKISSITGTWPLTSS